MSLQLDTPIEYITTVTSFKVDIITEDLSAGTLFLRYAEFAADGTPTGNFKSYSVPQAAYDDFVAATATAKTAWLDALAAQGGVEAGDITRYTIALTQPLVIVETVGLPFVISPEEFPAVLAAASQEIGEDIYALMKGAVYATFPNTGIIN